jgi:exonuclease V gamma subunit
LQTLLTATRVLPPGEYGKGLFAQEFKALDELKVLDASKRLQFAKADRNIINISIEDHASGKTFRISGQVNQVEEILNITMTSRYPGARSRITFYLSSLCNSCQTRRETQEEDLAVIGTELLTLPPRQPDAARQKLLELLLLAEKAKTEVIPLLSKSSLTAATDGTPDKIKGDFYNAYTGKGDFFQPHVKNFFSLENFDDETFMDDFRRLAETVHAPWVKKGK